MKSIDTSTLPASVFVKHQVKTYGPKRMANGDVIVAKVGHDDNCGNGHNTFSMTAEIYGPDRIPGETTIKFHGKTYWCHSGGCCHDEIAEAFPELAPFIKWHLTSTDGPMHYVANTLYWAGKSGYCNGAKSDPPNFENARSCAVWPEATDEQLSLPPDEFKALLLNRLPVLMAEFKAAVESLGFTY